MCSNGVDYIIPDEMAEIASHVLRGECPPASVDGLTGCMWAGDCTECWWFALSSSREWRALHGITYT